MRRAVLVGPRRFEIEVVALPSPGLDEVLVEVVASGVCASELEVWREGEGAPCHLGHEVAGRVIATGGEVTSCKVGDRVTGLLNAGFADQAVTTADRIAIVPDGIRLRDAYGEPLACAMSAARRTRVEPGDRIAVIGLGFMGLLMLQLLRLKGSASITGIDPRAEARANAARLGADLTLAPDEVGPDLRVVMPIRRGEDRGFDVVVEATGGQAGLTLAGELVRLHGFLSILGYHQGGSRQVDMQLWNFKAIDVLNAHERRTDYRMDCMRRALALAAAGRIELASLTTHTFGLEYLGDAFEALNTKPPGFIKSVILSNEHGD